MSKEVKFDIAKLIKEKLDLINNPELQNYLAENPSFLSENIYQDTNKVEDELIKLNNKYNEIKPFIEELEQNIKNINDNSTLNAVFLLMSSVSAIFSSVFLL
jgi:predicted nuclease with TOPRIM domain